MRIFNSSTIFVVAGLALGLGSALQSLETLGMQSIPDSGGWKEWRLDPDDNLRPYALGHFLAAGSVPTPVSTHYFVRDRDDDGDSLRGDCIFTLDGPVISARWWSLSLQGSGAAKAQAILSAGRAILGSERQLHATIDLHPAPGNWLQPADTGPFTLNYVVSEPEQGQPLTLPHVKKGNC